MFCPNCGANNTTEHRFCRSCGLNLERTAESLLEQIPSAESAEHLKKQKPLERFGKFALGGLGVVGLIAVAGIIYKIFELFILSGKEVFAGSLFIGLIVFAVLTAIFGVWWKDAEYYKKKSKMTKELENPTNRFLEEKPFGPIPTVTENTTDFLYAEQKTRTFE
jgi:hypothetical protein